jgi:hypothetical protein
LLGPCQRTLVHDLLARPGERERAQDEESRYPLRLARPVFLTDSRHFAEAVIEDNLMASPCPSQDMNAGSRRSRRRQQHAEFSWAV